MKTKRVFVQKQGLTSTHRFVLTLSNIKTGTNYFTLNHGQFKMEIK